jgi:SAM-dependent MidA family methyltransferase
VIEVGPGEGGFAAAVLSALSPDLRAVLRYVLVERMPEARDRQRARLGADAPVEWVRSIVELGIAPFGFVFANEVIDNAPVHVVEARAGKLLEVCVTVEGDRLSETLLEPSNPELAAYVARSDVELQEGARFEIGLGAEAMAGRLAAVIQRGAVLFVDYGDSASGLATRPRGTLLAYGADGVSDDVLSSPGTRDITAHANWTALSNALRSAGMDVFGPITQADALRTLGAGELDAGLKEEHREALERKDGAGAVATLSRRQALRALMDPGGLGGLQVLGGTRSIASLLER